jgi:hypothetical protein
MTATLFLRLASVFTLIHCVLHTIGGVFGKPQHGAEELALIESMKAHQWDFMGSLRAYYDFFFGYGLMVTINLLFQGILFWMLGGLIKTNPGGIKAVAALFCINYLLMSVVAFKYFFAAPGITEALIAVCLAAACLTAPAQ